jgi:hypothetical protein
MVNFYCFSSWRFISFCYSNYSHFGKEESLVIIEEEVKLVEIKLINYRFSSEFINSFNFKPSKETVIIKVITIKTLNFSNT